MLRLGLALALVSTLTACGAHAPPQGSAAPAPPRAAPAREPSPAAIAFVEDDYARALAEARAKGLPLFVDAWAPWCHSCVSMRQYVLRDPALARLAERFVWLSIDTEREANAPFLARFPVRELPTLWVIDAASERPTLKWPGAATAAELVELLEGAASGAGDTAAAASLLQGNRAAAEGRAEEALAAYRQSLASAPKGWARRKAVVEALASKLAETARFAECVALVRAEAPGLPRSTSLSAALVSGIGCARATPEGSAERGALRELVDRAIALARAGDGLLADDRSGLFEESVEALRAEGEKEAARALASEWAAFLEGAARAARSAPERAVFDSHRLGAYLALGDPARAIPMLQESERELPTDYNPPARLARAYFELGRHTEALSAVRRALDKGYGPRMLRVYDLWADILLARGDRAGARAALREAVAYARRLPLPGGYPKLLEKIERRLGELPAP